MPPLPFSVSAPPRAGPAPPRAVAAGAVLALALLQLAVGISLLALFESYKVYYFGQVLPRWYHQQQQLQQQAQQQQQPAGDGVGGNTPPAAPDFNFAAAGPPPPNDPHDWRSPMGIVFWLAVVSNVFGIAGVAGVVHGHQQLIVAFFAYSTLAVVALAHLFVDMMVESKIDYNLAYGGGGPGAGEQQQGQPPGPSGYEKAAAALVFVQLLVSGAATALSLRAADEVRRRKQYKHVSDLASNLAFEPDEP